MKNFLKAIGKATLYLLVYFGIQLAVSMVAGIVLGIYAVLSGDVDMTTLENDILSYTTIILLISNTLTLLFVWVFFKIRKKSLATEVQLHECSIKQVLAVAVFGLGFSFASSWIIEMIPFPESMVESFVTSHDTLSVGNPIVNFFAVVILAPVVEEVFFRGLIYTRLKSGMPKVVAAVISAITFGVMHGEVIWMLFAFVVGLMLVWVFEKTNSLLACIVVHVANNGLSQLTENTPEIPRGVDWAIFLVSVIVMVVTAVYIIKSSNKMSSECLCKKTDYDLENVENETIF